MLGAWVRLIKMKRIIGQICLFLLCGSLLGDTVWLGNINDITWNGSGTTVWADYGGGVVPPEVSNLILEYLMNANGSESTITLDTSGNNYTGTVTTATWQTATNGLTSYYDLTAAGGRISSVDTGLIDDLNVQGSNSISISIWANQTTLSTSDALLTRGRSSGADFSYCLANDNTTAGALRWIVEVDGTLRIVTSPALTADKWHHIIGSYDGTNVELFVDNESVGTPIVDEGVIGTTGNYGIMLGQWWDVPTASASSWNGYATLLTIPEFWLTPSDRTATNLYQRVQLGIASKASYDLGLDSNKVMDVTHNTTYQDGSTNNATVTATDVADYSLGITNSAGTYNGSSSKLGVATDYKWFDRTDPFSGIAWIKSDNSGLEMIISKLTSNGSRGWGLDISSGLLELRVANTLSSNDILVRGTDTINDDFWHQVAFTTDGTSDATNYVLYIDGEIASSTVVRNGLSATITNAVNFNVGSQGGSANYFDGNIDEAKVYNTALTASEVGSLYTNEWTKFGQLAGIQEESWWGNVVGLWTFNVANSQDYSGNGNNGTDTAMAYSIGSGDATFNGSTSEIDVPDTAEFGFTNTMTVAFWTKIDAGSDDNNSFVSKWSGTTADKAFTFLTEDNIGGTAGDLGIVILQSDNTQVAVWSSDYYHDPTASTLTNWNHVCGTADGTNINLYVNGVINTNVAYDGTLNVGSTSLTMGILRPADNIYELDGKLDNCILLNTALSSNEVFNLYNDQPHGGQ